MLTFENENERISTEEARYWTRMFLSNLKIGVEMEVECRDGSSYDNISTFKEILMPSYDCSQFGENGINNVERDGSLISGAEIQTVGRRVDFLDLYAQYKYIYEQIKDNAYVNERCGLHNHILLDYNSRYSSLEKPVPGVIFKNFIQLLRRYAPELVWITSTVKDEQSITRYDYYSSKNTLFRFTPLTRTVESFCDKINEYSRYTFINTRRMNVSRDNINIFHLELRFPDGSIYPAQIAAQNVLYAAMLLKAIELSQIGIISTGSREEWEETKQLIDSIRNDNMERRRMSSPPTEEQIDRIKQRGFEFLKDIKSKLDVYDSHVYRILYFLCEKPISLMRREMEDEDIVRTYDDLIKSFFKSDIIEHKELIKIIVSQEITSCYNQNLWEGRVADKLHCKIGDVKNMLFDLNQTKKIRFDNEIGAVVFD